MMLKRKLLVATKLTIVGIISILGMGFSHSTGGNTMPDMVGHSSKPRSAQCQSVCMSALPAEKQEKLLPVWDEDKEPKPQPLYIGVLGAAILAALFINKRSASFTSSWRPPDITLLHGHYADGL